MSVEAAAPAQPKLPIRVRSGSPANWAIRALWVLATIAFVVFIPTKAQSGTIGDMTFALELAICAMGLNLVMSYGGVVSLGHSAFFGIGGYVTAILATRYGWPVGWTIPLAAVGGFVFGVLVSLPALRLKGVYLALVTLGVAVLFPSLVKWPKLEWLTEGARGIHGFGYDEIPELSFWEGDRPREARAVWTYWVAVVVLVLCYLVCRGVVKSRVGRSLIAIRDNEVAASVMGVDVARTKALVFGVSAAITAVGGSMFAIRAGQVNVVDIPYFTIVGSILFLVVMVLGGAATLWGPIVGAVVYVYVEKSARQWGLGAGEDASPISKAMDKVFGWATTSPASLILSVIILGMMFIAPFGIVGLFRRIAARFVVVMPRPAGSAATVRDVEVATADLVLAETDDPFDSTASTTDTGGPP